ncbi:PQQ-binding-like beta-propeller repeat protein [Cohnella sp. AR92]|uniref:outer membrane protein assembly factor BamB family protein n=1 Tax=Cohnella sp. AR92 TaxID=648716 RepID=UPI000F8CE95E|nr:PQQ-binding-like beta-propeller repeat protein [Cohnella sp. AR92]RUS47147.1 pyrrolo-quinoline quinone [Cohnella sp. AR92]
MRSRRITLLALLVLHSIGTVIGNSASAASQIQYRWNVEPKKQSFPAEYTDVEGVLTFRGSADRSAPSFGTADMKTFVPRQVWKLTTRSSSWGGGAGWTGQPAIVRWQPEVLKAMNVKDKFKSKTGFTEVIYASLDGYVYFLDLETGEQTRNPLKIGNPIKGSVSVDSRGYPLLYVGEGIPENGTIGFGLYSLIDQKRLFYMKGIDSFAKRGWGAFDSSALFNRYDDTLLVGGENGMFYSVKLNTQFSATKKTLTIKPEVSKYRYSIAGNSYQGIENSVAVYDHYAFFADNGGSLQAIDLTTNKPIWSLPSLDDTDATIVIETENGIPFLYTGTEVDKQGSKGYAVLRKINGFTGEAVWQRQYACFTQRGDHPVNGGLLATPVLGKQSIDDRVIFTIARYGSFGAGLMVALDKKTGKEIWTWKMANYAWSSPVDVYDRSGNASLLQADSAGNFYVLSALTGQVKGRTSLGANTEASPAVFNDYAVVATRGGKIYGLKLE